MGASDIGQFGAFHGEFIPAFNDKEQLNEVIMNVSTQKTDGIPVPPDPSFPNSATPPCLPMVIPPPFKELTPIQRLCECHELSEFPKNSLRKAASSFGQNLRPLSPSGFTCPQILLGLIHAFGFFNVKAHLIPSNHRDLQE